MTHPNHTFVRIVSGSGLCTSTMTHTIVLKKVAFTLIPTLWSRLVRPTRTLEEMGMTMDSWSFNLTLQQTRFEMKFPPHIVTLSYSLTATCHHYLQLFIFGFGHHWGQFGHHTYFDFG